MGLTRRGFVATGTAALGTLPGCTAFESDPDGAVLAGVELGNATEETQTFHVLVEYDDEIVHWSSHDVEPAANEGRMGGTIVDPEVPAEPGRVVVHGCVGDRRASTDLVEAGFDGECVVETYIYGFRGDEALSAHPTTVDSLEDPPDSLECPDG